MGAALHRLARAVLGTGIRALALSACASGIAVASASGDTPGAVGAAPAPAYRSRELVRETFTLDHLSSDWEVLLPALDDVYPAGGRLRVVPDVAADWDAPSRVPNLVRYRFPLEGSDLEARTKVEIAIDSPGHGAALVLYQDDRNWVELAYRGERGADGLERVLRLTREVGGKKQSVERRQGHGAAAAPESLVLVLARRGDVFDGRVEIPTGTPGIARKASVGLVRAPGLGQLQLMLKAMREEPPPRSADPGVVYFDDVVAVGRSADADLGRAPPTLRVVYATDFRDPQAFHRDFSVLRPDPGSLVLENGLELVARYGIPGDRWTPIRNLVVRNQPLPSGDFDVEVEVDARFTSRHDDVGVVLYGEQGNAIHLGHWSLPTADPSLRQAYLRTVQGGRGDTRFSPDPATQTGIEATTLVFRIEHTKRGYTGWIDVAGRGWVKLGETDLALTEPRVGVFARSARDRGSVPGAGVRFSRLWVMTEEP